MTRARHTFRNRWRIAQIYYQGQSYFRHVYLAKRGKILLCSCGGVTPWYPLRDADQLYIGQQSCIHIIALCRNEFEAKNKHETKPNLLFCELTAFGETLFHHRWTEKALLENG